MRMERYCEKKIDSVRMKKRICPRCGSKEKVKNGYNKDTYVKNVEEITQGQKIDT